MLSPQREVARSPYLEAGYTISRMRTDSVYYPHVSCACAIAGTLWAHCTRYPSLAYVYPKAPSRDRSDIPTREV